MSRPRGPSVDRPLAKLPEDVERALADVPCRLDGPFSYQAERTIAAIDMLTHLVADLEILCIRHVAEARDNAREAERERCLAIAERHERTAPLEISVRIRAGQRE